MATVGHHLLGKTGTEQKKYVCSKTTVSTSEATPPEITDGKLGQMTNSTDKRRARQSEMLECSWRANANICIVQILLLSIHVTHHIHDEYVPSSHNFETQISFNFPQRFLDNFHPIR